MALGAGRSPTQGDTRNRRERSVQPASPYELYATILSQTGVRLVERYHLYFKYVGVDLSSYSLYFKHFGVGYSR